MINGEIKTGLSKSLRKRELIDAALLYALTLLIEYGVNLFTRTVFNQLALWLRIVLMPVCALIVALPAAILLLLRRDRLQTLNIEKRTLPRQILVGILFGVAFSFVFTFIPHLFGLHDWVGGSGKNQPLWYIAYCLFYIIFAVALSEEFIFRCFFYEKIKRSFNTDLASVIGSSLLFGLFHCFTGGGIAQIVCTALIGAVLALLRLKVKSCTIVSLIVLHGVYDWLIIVWANVF